MVWERRNYEGEKWEVEEKRAQFPTLGNIHISEVAKES